jgi:glycerophosphoryl diester phosphodiesterase
MKKYTHFIFFGLILTYSCSKYDQNTINLNGNRIDVLGHAGSGISSIYPINSYESIKNVLTKGADGSEVDLQITKDNVLVLYHDENLNESTNLSGRVSDLNWDEIKDGKYITGNYSNYRICSLEDLMNQLDKDKNITFDIKLFAGSHETFEAYTERFSQEVLNFESSNTDKKIIIETQDLPFAQLLKEANPILPVFYYPQDFSIGLQIALDNDLDGITIANDNISSEEVEIAHQNDIWVTIWGIKNKKEIRSAISKNPDHIQTDNIKYTLKYLNQ